MSDLPPDGWNPMTTVRHVRDGRHIILLPDNPSDMPDDAATFMGGVIAHWSWGEREWFIATDLTDLGDASGRGLIDDHFIGWRGQPLPEEVA